MASKQSKIPTNPTLRQTKSFHCSEEKIKNGNQQSKVPFSRANTHRTISNSNERFDEQRSKRIEDFAHQITESTRDLGTNSIKKNASKNNRDFNDSLRTSMTDSVGVYSVNETFMPELNLLEGCVPPAVLNSISSELNKVRRLQEEAISKSQEVIEVATRIRTCMLPSLSQFDSSHVLSPMFDRSQRISIPRALVSRLSELSFSYVGILNDIMNSITDQIELIESMCQALEDNSDEVEEQDEINQVEKLKNENDDSQSEEKDIEAPIKSQNALSQMELVFNQLLRKREKLAKKVQSHQSFINKICTISNRIMTLQSQVIVNQTVQSTCGKLNSHISENKTDISETFKSDCRTLERLLRKATSEISWSDTDLERFRQENMFDENI